MIRKLLSIFRITAYLVNLWSVGRRYLKSKGWFESSYRQMPVDAKGDPIPWLTYSSIHFMNNRLNKSMSIFEFGSGNSTLWFASKVKDVISIEHDKVYFKSVSDQITTNSNIDYRLANLGENYHQQIEVFKKAFDVVIIDGRERVKCAYSALNALKEDGVIIWDNSDRKEYDKGYEFLKENGFKRIDFVGMSPGVNFECWTSLFYRENNCFKV